MTEESIFAAALALGSPAERAAFLDRVCTSPALRQSLDELLAAHVSSNALDRPPADLARTGAYESEDGPRASVGDRVGPYKLLERIGEGGMGEVWVADQLEPLKRRVALKLIKPGMDSRAVLARFEAERQALAVMDHPNIAKVLDAGTTPDGRPFFVMELVKGTPITEFCDARKLSPRQRLELFIPVCQAIQHAHMKGIIHRDIKPTNVLVALHDELPVPKVIDFGVAKAIGQQLTEKTIYTGFGALIGTPAYMAPEQATFNQLDVDTRADVYALGVLLYELLTGTPPVEPERLKKAALDEVLRIVRDEEPPRPSQRLSTSQAKATIAAVRQSDPAKLSNLLRGEVDWIVMKALEKDRTRRYDTATALAKDVQRYLTGEMVEARPPTLGYRFRKFANKKSTIIGTIFFVSMLPSLGWAIFGMLRAQDAEKSADNERIAAIEQRNIAEDARKEMVLQRDEAVRLGGQLKRANYHTSIALAAASIESGQIKLTRDLLEGTRPKTGDKDDPRGWEWHYLRRAIQGEKETITGPDVPADAIAFSPDGRFLVVAHGGLLGNGLAGSLRVIDLHKKLPERSLPLATGKATGLVFSRDGSRLAANVSIEKRTPSGLLTNWGGDLRVWNFAEGTLQITHTVSYEEGRLARPAFSPDGKKVAVISRGIAGTGLVVFETETGKTITTRKLSTIMGVGDVAYTAQGRLLVAYHGFEKDPAVRLLDLGSEDGPGRVVFDPGRAAAEPWTISLENEGSRLVVAWMDRQVRGWDLTGADPKPTFQFRAESMAVMVDGFRLTPDNRFCIMCPGYYGPIVPVWDVKTGRQVFSARGHTAGVSGLTISPDGRTLATASEDKTVKLWNLPAVQTGPELAATLNTSGIAARADGGFRVLTHAPIEDDNYGRFAVRDVLPDPDAPPLFLGPPRSKEKPDESLRNAILSPDGNYVMTRNWELDGRVALWSVKSGLRAPEFPAEGIPCRFAEFVTADSVLIRQRDGSGQLHEIPSGRAIGPPVWAAEAGDGPRGGAWVLPAGDGKLVAVREKTIRILDRTGAVLRSATTTEHLSRAIAVSPDASTLAVVFRDLVSLIDTRTGAVRHVLRGHIAVVRASAAFSPDGKRLFTGSLDQTVKVWDTVTGQEMLTLRFENPILKLALSADGHRLAVQEQGNGRGTIFDATPLEGK